MQGVFAAAYAGMGTLFAAGSRFAIRQLPSDPNPLQGSQMGQAEYSEEDRMISRSTGSGTNEEAALSR
ncbi:MAG TPA: hypothetical protein VG734_17910 [Lacunisphaera sp.]|nr:hypothetical protein [Lacunisphaera sp.]